MHQAPCQRGHLDQPLGCAGGAEGRGGGFLEVHKDEEVHQGGRSQPCSLTSSVVLELGDEFSGSGDKRRGHVSPSIHRPLGTVSVSFT